MLLILTNHPSMLSVLLNGFLILSFETDGCDKKSAIIAKKSSFHESKWYFMKTCQKPDEQLIATGMTML